VQRSHRIGNFLVTLQKRVAFFKGGTPMNGKERLIADQDRVIAKKVEIIAILERHRQADTDKMIAECRRIISECEKSKAIILAH
jgi:hypothetical protein